MNLEADNDVEVDELYDEEVQEAGAVGELSLLPDVFVVVIIVVVVVVVVAFAVDELSPLSVFVIPECPVSVSVFSVFPSGPARQHNDRCHTSWALGGQNQ